MRKQPEPTEQNARALLIRAIENDDFLMYLAAMVCFKNLAIMGAQDERE